jgi:hypothetical protein
MPTSLTRPRLRFQAVRRPSRNAHRPALPLLRNAAMCRVGIQMGGKRTVTATTPTMVVQLRRAIQDNGRTLLELG